MIVTVVGGIHAGEEITVEDGATFVCFPERYEPSIRDYMDTTVTSVVPPTVCIPIGVDRYGRPAIDGELIP